MWDTVFTCLLITKWIQNMHRKAASKDCFLRKREREKRDVHFFRNAAARCGNRIIKPVMFNHFPHRSLLIPAFVSRISFSLLSIFRFVFQFFSIITRFSSIQCFSCALLCWEDLLLDRKKTILIKQIKKKKGAKRAEEKTAWEERSWKRRAKNNRAENVICGWKGAITIF